MSSKKWISLTIGISFFFLLLIGTSMYYMDPYNYYGNNNQLYLNDVPAFASAAALLQEDYDTAIIGSSLSLGIAEEYVNSTMNCHAINLSYSGCTAHQRKVIIDALCREGKADTILCDLLLSNYVNDGNQNINEMQADTFPSYLFDTNPINDVKYLFNFDILFKMSPRIIFTEIAAMYNLPVSKSYFQPYSAFHQNSAWTPADDWSASFSRLQTTETIVFSDAEIEKIIADMHYKVDSYLVSAAAANPEETIIFYFPPYSALYWCEVSQRGYLDVLLDTKEYIVNRLSPYENVILYDFQTADMVLDLGYYHDSLHYTIFGNEFIIDSIAENHFILSSYDKEADRQRILSQMLTFQSIYENIPHE